MALSLGKLAILVGAGIFGSVLAKEGKLPSVSDVLSGAAKIAFKKDSAPSSSKPKNDALAAQVNSLKQELQFLASNRPVTIITSGGGGGRRYGVIVLCVVVGYGYIWWKGWKLPDLTFATKRSLSDACTSIAKQLEQVYSSIGATKRDLSRQIDRADCSLNDLSEINVATKHEVSHLRGEMETFDVNIQSVREVVESLESRIQQMQGNGDAINMKVMRLVDVAKNIEGRRSPDALQGAPSTASRPAIEQPHILQSSRSLSMPRTLSLEPPSPLSSGSNETQHQLNGPASATGLKISNSMIFYPSQMPPMTNLLGAESDLEEMSQGVSSVTSSPKISDASSNGIGIPLSAGATGSAAGGFFSRKIITTNIPFLSRTRSSTPAFK